jgi:hypothetical protein
VAMPDGKSVIVTYRLDADKRWDGCGVILRGKPGVINHLLRHNAVCVEVTPELDLHFKYTGQSKKRPTLIYAGANPLKKRRRRRV